MAVNLLHFAVSSVAVKVEDPGEVETPSILVPMEGSLDNVEINLDQLHRPDCFTHLNVDLNAKTDTFANLYEKARLPMDHSKIEYALNTAVRNLSEYKHTNFCQAADLPDKPSLPSYEWTQISLFGDKEEQDYLASIAKVRTYKNAIKERNTFLDEQDKQAEKAGDEATRIRKLIEELSNHASASLKEGKQTMEERLLKTSNDFKAACEASRQTITDSTKAMELVREKRLHMETSIEGRKKRILEEMRLVVQETAEIDGFNTELLKLKKDAEEKLRAQRWVTAEKQKASMKTESENKIFQENFHRVHEQLNEVTLALKETASSLEKKNLEFFATTTSKNKTLRTDLASKYDELKSNAKEVHNGLREHEEKSEEALGDEAVALVCLNDVAVRKWLEGIKGSKKVAEEIGKELAELFTLV
eukprot:TRINITY_DN19318_c0_g2_i1.p1 TRINITY_DN19318_c0_g2~~TRINITY_DN19318_c0_g2_i1.p1  ORF type:complete len:418 (+),score=110.45 TRINITY_DN19318_c0_g2_i1:66-1319(+)